MNFVCHFFNVAKLSPSVLLCDRSSQFTHVWCEETFLMILGQDQDFSDPGLLPWLPSLSRPHQSLWYSLGTWMTLCPKKMLYQSCLGSKGLCSHHCTWMPCDHLLFPASLHSILIHFPRTLQNSFLFLPPFPYACIRNKAFTYLYKTI